MTRKLTSYLLILFIAFPWTVFCDDLPVAVDQLPLTEVEGDPSGTIADCISIISGAYQDFDEDIAIPGIEPLTYQRIYCSRDWGGGTLCDSWTYNHAQNVHLTNENKLFYIVASESTGGAVSYWESKVRHKGSGKKRVYKVPDHCVEAYIKIGRDTGLTNTGSGIISGATNLRNQIFSFDLDQSKVAGSLADGGCRLYKKLGTSSSLPQHYLLEKEIYPNGNQFKYTYADVGYNRRRRGGTQRQISSIEALNASGTCSFGSLHFDYSGCLNKDDSHVLKVRAHDGREASYKFSHVELPRKEKKYHRWYLTEVERPNAPNIKYEYVFADHWEAAMVNKKTIAGRVVRALHYYMPGVNCLFGWCGFEEDPCGMIELEASKHREKRVSTLLAPVGIDDALIRTHHFLYEKGHTEVRDAYNYRTSYRYSEEERLTDVEHYLGTDAYTLYSIDKLFWGDPKTDKGSDLQCRAVCYPDGTVRSCRWLEYDDDRNVVAEHLLGNLSGNHSIAVELDANGIPLDNASERYSVRRTFSNDRFHLVRTESFPNGRFVNLRYKADTNLLAAKFTQENGNTVLREFYDYDSNASMIRSIRDDGSGEHVDDLTDVTVRTITLVTPRTQQPGIGLPEVIEERYFDPETRTECLLHRIAKSYTREGWCTREERYDATNSLAYVLQWEHDSYGNVISEQDALGRTTTRRFDPFGNKIFEQGPDSSYHTEYVYDYSNRLVSESRIGWTEESHTLSYRYDLRGNKIAGIDAQGNETCHRYDALNRLIETTLPACTDINGHNISLTSTYEYDISGNITRTVDFDGGVTQKTFNIRGLATQIIHPDGSKESFTYNLDGSLAEQIALNGSKTLYLYNALGKCIRKTQYSSTGELLAESEYIYKGKRLIAEIDPNGHMTTYAYDGAGRLTSKRTPETETIIHYDALGRAARTSTAISSQPGNIQVKRLIFDLLNRPIEERVEDSSGTLLKRISTTYDLSGRVFQLTKWNARGASTLETEYDFMGRVTRAINAEGFETITHYSDVINAYGQRVLQIAQVDALGRCNTTTQDPLGRSHSNVTTDPYGVVLATHTNIYDGKGRLARRTDLVKAQGQPDRHFVTEWHYDSNGHVVELVQGADTPLRRQTFYTYNEAGQKQSEMTPDGTELVYTYDGAGRLFRLLASDNTIDYTYAYDAKGNLLHVHDAVHSMDTYRQYDGADRVIVETLGNNLSLKSTYDGLGRLILLELPDHSSVAWTYDAAFMRSVLRYDAAGLQQYSYAYLSYDLSGQAQTMQMIGNCGQIRQEWDALSRPVVRECAQYREEIPKGGFDAVGNLLKASRKDFLGDIACAYHYDSRDHLCQEDTFTLHSYQYDSLDNRLQKDGQPCVVDALNQLLAQGDVKYGYDERGNRVSQLKDGITTHFKFDALGRLIETSREGTRCVYRYDSFNRRLSKTTYSHSDTSTENYLYQGQMDIGMVDASGTLQQLRALGEGLGAEIAAAVAIEVGGAIYAPIHDFQGSIVALANPADGKVVQAYRYTAFGEETIHSTDSLEPISPWRFSSKRVDPETSLVYFGRRYFDPDTGRWLTQDPTGYQDGPNLYAYVHNAPLTHVDLYGLWAIGFSMQEGPYINIFGMHLAPFAQYGSTNCQLSDRQMRPRVSDRPIHCSGFERVTRFKELSSDYQEGDEEFEFGSITQINGIQTDKEQARANSNHVSRLGGNVRVFGTHNSSGSLFIDLIECIMGYCGVTTTPVRLLQAQWCKQLAKGGTVLHFCHSQGAIHTKNALMTFPQELRERIMVVAIAPAAYISDDLCRRVVHYRTESPFRDPVTRIDRTGAYRCRHTIRELKSDPTANLHDHNFTSKTYEDAIGYHIERYINTRGQKI